MNYDRPRGLLVTGTSTGIGKTYVAARIARAVARTGRRVGVYKPAASGCEVSGDELICEDARQLWQGAGQPGELARVCPQKFAPPLAPHLAARQMGQQVDPQQLRTGLEYWLERSDFLVVEGAGGLMSPISDRDYVADLVVDFGLPLIVVSANVLGTINLTLQTLITAATYGDGLRVAGIVLNDLAESAADLSAQTNRAELEARCAVPLLAHLAWQQEDFQQPVDWYALGERR